MDVHAENLKSIVEQGREMAKAGHFDSAGILKKVDAFDRRQVPHNSGKLLLNRNEKQLVSPESQPKKVLEPEGQQQSIVKRKSLFQV